MSKVYIVVVKGHDGSGNVAVAGSKEQADEYERKALETFCDPNEIVDVEEWEMNSIELMEDWSGV